MPIDGLVAYARMSAHVALTKHMICCINSKAATEQTNTLPAALHLWRLEVLLRHIVVVEADQEAWVLGRVELAIGLGDVGQGLAIT